MPVRRISIVDFRNLVAVDLELAEGRIAVIGDNGQGKTNLMEALVWLTTASSFRGAPTEALVREGAEHAILRAEVESEGRTTLLEVELAAVGRNRMQVNRNRVSRVRDLLGHLVATVFGPDDLALVKGGPAGRRRYMDDLLIASHPRHHSLVTDLERILRQRNTLLRQAGGRMTREVEETLDVWDDKLAGIGEELGRARRDLVVLLRPELADILDVLGDGTRPATMEYESHWLDMGLGPALVEARRDDIRRGVTTVGPHRDDLCIGLGGMPSRTHASQGEQRSLALALRLGGHRVLAERLGVEPVIILDDVFSELDPGRAGRLVGLLPSTQVFVTAAGSLPEGIDVDRVIRIEAGSVASDSEAGA
ncbi:MAG: DNA replication/repair protein RecF [Actinobacteria bacterium]|nr:DNA replication/repair protein RecF [Actinomycetota bacterium]